MYQKKLMKLSDSAHESEVILLMNPTNIYYVTGFMSEPHERFYCLLIDVKKNETILFLPSLDKQAATSVAQVDKLMAVADGEDGFAKLATYVNKHAHVAIEKDYVTVSDFEELLKIFDNKTFANITPMIERARLNKSETEIAKTKRAITITEEALECTLPQIEVGMTELAVKALLEYELKRLGAEQLAFDTLVLAGKNSALPHGVSSNTQIEQGDFLLFDFGVYVDQYCSDITRTFVVGKASEEQRIIYETVKKANEAAIAAVQIDAPLKSIDLAAREVIEQAGYGEYFTHRVGHGMGLDVHEAPSVHHENETKITGGLLFTIEPGIYIPEIGGVRIEDDLYVRDDGTVEVLTSYTKELVSI